MKKKLALLLAMVLTLSALFCLAPAASVAAAEPTTAPSQEIAYFNVSIKTNVELLFAVPAEGAVDSLKLLIWEEGKSNGTYSFSDAETNGEVLSPKGLADIKDKSYLIFKYSGLSATQMSENVYIRSFYTTSDYRRIYGEIHDYSIAEYANVYLNNENSQQKELVEAMMDYGHFAADYKGKTSYTSAEVKALKKVTVTTVFGQNTVGKQTQLVTPGVAVTLKAPIIAEAQGVAPTWKGTGITDTNKGIINTTTDVDVTATYSPKKLFTANYNQYIKSDGKVEFNMPGTGISSAYDKNSTSSIDVGTLYKPAADGITTQNYVWETYTGYNIGNNFKVANAHPYSYAKWEICGPLSEKAKDADGNYLKNSKGILYYSTTNNQYMRYSHNGCGLLTLDKSNASGSVIYAFVTSSRANGMADSMAFTYELDLMSGKNGTFPYTRIGFDRYLDPTNGDGKNSPDIMSFNPDGSVTLAGTPVQYNGLNTNVIAESISQTKFQKVAVSVDLSEGRYYGYLDGKLVAVTDCTKLYDMKTLYTMIDGLTNTRCQLVMRGGYGGNNWTADNGKLQAAKAAVVDLDGDGTAETNVYDAATDKWNVKALEKYVDENYYFYYDNMSLMFGMPYAK